MFKKLKYDIAQIKERDPAARTSFEVFMLYSGLRAIISHRFAHRFYKKKIFFIAT